MVSIYNDLHERFQLDLDGYYVLETGINNIPKAHWDSAIKQNPKLQTEIANLNIIPLTNVDTLQTWLNYKSNAKFIKDHSKILIQYLDFESYLDDFFAQDGNEKATFGIYLANDLKNWNKDFEFVHNFASQHQDNPICVKDLAEWTKLDIEAQKAIKAAEQYLGTTELINFTFDDWKEFKVKKKSKK